MDALKEWEAFYLVAGGAAAGLTGLQFVVVTLAAEAHVLRPSSNRAFGTPTIVHFSVVLLMSALLTAPWHSLRPVAACLAVTAVSAVVYAGFVVRHTRKQKDYTPVLEDWVWHAIVPIAAYGLLLVAAICLEAYESTCLFLVGGACLALLFTGIHNAWDSVTYIALSKAGEDPAAGGDS
jgi:amino acid transporter